jgi:hypothetical protein
MRGAPLDARILLLRIRLREIRSELTAARSSLRLAACGVLAALAVAALWLIGHLGFHLGAAPMLGLSELEAASGGLALGTRLLVNAPFEIYRAGLDDPARLVVGFVAVAIPAALLPLALLIGAGPILPRGGAATARRRFGSMAATLAMIASALFIFWICTPFRLTRLTPLPSDLLSAAPWLSGRSVVAGLDALAATSAVLWVVLLVQIDVPGWLRSLAGTITALAAAIMLVAATTSNGAAAELNRPLASIRLSSESGEAALLGEAMGGPVLLRRVGSTSILELQAVLRGAVVGRTTLRDTLLRTE